MDRRISVGARWLTVAVAGGVLAGCGFLGSAPSPTHSAHPAHHPHPVAHHPRPAPKPPAHHATPTPTPPNTHGGNSHSGTPTPPAKHPSNGPTPTPAPPNVGTYTQLDVDVQDVKPLGTVTENGAVLDAYALTIEVYNPTPAFIRLALNDFSAIPANGPAGYSWNDYVTTGLTQATSLFWPLGNPADPGSVTTVIAPGARVIGTVSVAVPQASRYALAWAPYQPADTAATFTP